MVYEIIFTETAKRQLSRLEKGIQERIIRTLERIRIRPEDFLVKLVGYPAYKLRVGDYRVIIDLERDKLFILVLKVGHRRNIYQS